jgi:hypothetical protein
LWRRHPFAALLESSSFTPHSLVISTSMEAIEPPLLPFRRAPLEPLETAASNAGLENSGGRHNPWQLTTILATPNDPMAGSEARFMRTTAAAPNRPWKQMTTALNTIDQSMEPLAIPPTRNTVPDHCLGSARQRYAPRQEKTRYSSASTSKVLLIRFQQLFSVGFAAYSRRPLGWRNGGIEATRLEQTRGRCYLT